MENKRHHRRITGVLCILSARKIVENTHMSKELLKGNANFIRKIISDDLKDCKHCAIITRFPPEPNGYLHIGHAKSICLNFGLARDFGGECHLRFDDTNPEKEDEEYVRAIEADVRWLGFDWGKHLYHTSDYFEQLYQLAIKLIKSGKAYVDSLSAEQMREYRGTLTTPGKPSPDRNRPITESLDLFERMKQGEFAEGSYTLRAKIDMAAGNINLRDPALYRIRKATHQRSGDQWCIYPMYDFSHALSDAIEGITHSLCTLEFQDHRPLYDWCVAHCEMPHQPRQIEFSRLNLNYTVTSKRKLKQLVDEKIVAGWDDPRMPTLSGLRRRGVPPQAIVSFCEKIGISKQDSIIDLSVLEEEIRDHLNQSAPRTMAVLKPIKVIIENYPTDLTETFEVSVHPQNPDRGKRQIIFSRELYIDADDFMENPEKGFFRLSPETPARLLNAYVIYCQKIIKNAAGEITELHCTYDKETLGGKKPQDGRKVKGIIHWVSCQNAVDATVRVYDRLFNQPNPAATDNFLECINPNSLQIYHAKVEKSLATTAPETRFQFTRVGYFAADAKDHSDKQPTFNQVVSLRQDW